MSIDDELRSQLRSLADEAGAGPESRVASVRRRYRRRRTGQVAGTAVGVAAVLCAVVALQPVLHRDHNDAARTPADYYVSLDPSVLGPLQMVDATDGTPVRDVAPRSATVDGVTLELSGVDPTPVGGFVFLTRNGEPDGRPQTVTASLSRARTAGGPEDVLFTSTTDIFYQPVSNASGSVVAFRHARHLADGSFAYGVELLSVATRTTDVVTGLAADGINASILGWQGDTLLVGDSAGVHVVPTASGRALPSHVASQLGCPSGEMTGARLGDGRLLVGGSTCDVPGGTNVLGVRILHADGSAEPFTTLGLGSAMTLWTTSSGGVRVWTSTDAPCGESTLWAYDGTSARPITTHPQCASGTKD